MAAETDDWRLTAYALGELDASEAAAVERLLSGSASARRVVAEVRAVASAVERASAEDVEYGLTADQREAVLAGLRVRGARRLGRRRWVAAAAAAAAVIAVAAAWLIVAAHRSRQGEGQGAGAEPRTAERKDGGGPAVAEGEGTPGHRDSGSPREMGTPRVRRDAGGEHPGAGFGPPAAARGAPNVALHKPVTSSCEAFLGILDWITDGDREPGGGSFVELGRPGLQWVQIDLKARHRIRAVVVWHHLGGRRAYHDVVVQVSDDAAFERGVQTLFNNDQDNSASLGVGQDREYVESRGGLVIIPVGAAGRYVRLYSSGSTYGARNHYVEVEVYGREVGPAAGSR